MPYALFKNDLELSRGFDTYDVALKHAEDAGLTDKEGNTSTLIDGYTILEIEDEQPADTETAEEWSLPSRLN